MIFQYTWEMVCDGSKVETSCIKKTGEYFAPVIGSVFTKSHRLKWREGNDYAVQVGRGLPCLMRDEQGALWIPERRATGFCALYYCEEKWPISRCTKGGLIEKWKATEVRVRLLKIWESLVGDVTDEQAVDEGFETGRLEVNPRDVFLDTFFKINPEATLESKRWRLRFELVL